MNSRLLLSRLRRGALALLALTALPASPARAETVLQLFIWGDYIDPDVLRDFRAETGIRVVESNFSSNEEMLAKVQSGAVAYDLVTPSDYMVRVMRRRGLLRPLDRDQLPGLEGLAEEARDLPFDPGNEVSVPYKWGVTGIGYNRRLVARPPEGWADLFEPARLAAVRGRVSMLDDGREVIGAALVHLGLPNNSTNPEHLARAAAVLDAQRPFLAKYDSSSYYQSLAADELALAQGYSQEVALAQAENPDIGFVIPREGATVYFDTLAIPAASRQPKAAHRFIAFLLRPEVSARNANYTRGPSPVAAAAPLIERSLRDGIAYRLPPPSGRLTIEDVGEAEEAFNRLWTELKAR